MEESATALLRRPADQRPLRVAIVIGSTRPGRKGDAVARWVYERACGHTEAELEIVDLAQQELPMLDEPVPAIHGRYERAHTKAWARVIASFDAYVFVTPEYNRSIPGALKNAIDFLYAEWNDKAAGFVSYGADAGGARAVEHLRLVMGELRVADVRTHVALSLVDDFGEYTTPAPRPHQEERLAGLVKELVAWARALRTVREPAGLR
jgi:NAD(P)H-dependent FMN reductase